MHSPKHPLSLCLSHTHYPSLRPYTEETLEELGETGVKNLIVVPVSFVSEHIETLVR